MSLEMSDAFSVGNTDGLLRLHAAIVAAYVDVVQLMAEAKSKLKLPPLEKHGFSAKALEHHESLCLAAQMTSACCGADVAVSVFGLDAELVFGDAYLALSKDFGNLPPLVFARKLSGNSRQITPSYHAQLLLFATFKTMGLRNIFEGVIPIPENFLEGMERARRHLMIEDFHTNGYELNSDTLAMAKLEFVKAQEILREQNKRLVDIGSPKSVATREPVDATEEKSRDEVNDGTLAVKLDNNPPPLAEYLGITVDGKRRVHRTGYEDQEPVDLSTRPMQWCIFSLLVAKRGDYLGMDDIEDEQGETLSGSGLSREFSELRTRIERLGLGIPRSKPDAGWQLVEQIRRPKNTSNRKTKVKKK